MKKVQIAAIIGITAVAAAAAIILTILPQKERMFTKESFPRIDGSTATVPISVEIARDRIGLNKKDAQKFIRHYTTHQAYVRLTDNQSDILLVSEPSANELAMAKQKQVELEMIPIATDAFVFMTNRNNLVDSLTLQQIRDIYTGKTENWKDVGGSDRPIIAYQREANSGSQTAMENYVMKGSTFINPPSERKPGGMGEMIDKVSDYKDAEDAIGYSFHYYATTLNGRKNIKFFALNGVAPSKENILNKTYPLSGNAYAVIRKSEPVDSPARKLFNWLMTEEGQKVVKKSGYLGVQF